MLPQKKKKKGRNALKIAQLSQQDFRDMVEQNMDRKKLNKMFGPPSQGGLLRYLRETGQAKGPRSGA